MGVRHLKRRGAIWWFRRAIPSPLVPVIQRAELSRSLRTTDPRLARLRAGPLVLLTEELFTVAKTPNQSIAREQASVLLRRLAREPLWGSESATEIVAHIKAGDTSHVDLLFDAGSDDMTALPHKAATRVKGHLRRILDSYEALVVGQSARTAQLAGKTLRIRSSFQQAATAGQHLRETEALISQFTEVVGQQDSIIRTFRTAKTGNATGPRFSERFEDFLAVKTTYTEQTRQQNRKTCALWTELIGDGPVTAYTGQDADRFQVLLRQLPQSHGKGFKRPATEEIARAERSTVPVARIKEKTVKRHLSCVSQYWEQLSRWRLVPHGYNITEGMRFPGTRTTKSARDDWSAEDLVKLLGCAWGRKAIDGGTYRWMVAIAMHTGMRLEEIGRLRPQDVRIVEGIPMFLLDEQPGWSPKSEAGERAVAIHPALLRFGVMELAERARSAGHARLFPGLRPSGLDGGLTHEFSRCFSKHKVGHGFGAKTVFHSFRHTVSTILRNANADIRGEWIDATLGHEGADQSEGVRTYLKRIGPRNLRRTIEAIRFPEDVDTALDAFMMKATVAGIAINH